MASSTTTGDNLLPSPVSITFPPPPPPTPSNSTNHNIAFSDLLLKQLTPNLTLSHLPPTIFLRRQKSPLPSTPQPHTISLLHSQSQQLLTTAATDHGYFHLTDHNIPSHLPTSAHSEAHSLLLQRSSHSSHSCLGFDDEDEDDNLDFLVVDVGSESELSPSTVREFGREMGRLGVEVVEMMLEGSELKSPFKDGTVKPRLLLWVSSSAAVKESCGGGSGDEAEEDCRNGKGYPYVICLQYEMKWWSQVCLENGDDSDEVALVTRPGSVLVTVGDIAQVWSNGRFKKVRGSGIPSFSGKDETSNITISLMVTLPTESVISPLPRAENNSNSGSQEGDEDDIKFCSFPFEQYAWRLYHDNLSFKDPLLRYRL